MSESPEPFHNALMGEDELGVVIRAHIYVEAALNELVSYLGAQPEHVARMRLEYHQLVDLAVALGLSPDAAPALRALGKLRNDFAHKVDTVLTKPRVEALYKTLTSEDKQIAQRVYQSTNKKVPEKGRPNNVRALEPKDQFVLIAVALRAKIMAGIEQLKRREQDA